MVKEFNLTRKAWVNAKTILIGMFDYAKRKKYITDNPLSDMRITVRYKQVVKKSGNTQTYNTDELEELKRKYATRKLTATMLSNIQKPTATDLLF